MTGKKAIILTLLVIFTIQVTSPIKPALAQTNQATCASGIDASSIVTFISTVITSGAVLGGIDFITSAIVDTEVAGTRPQAFLEPFDEAADWIFNKWMWAVLLGLVGSIASWFAGFLVEFALGLNAGLLTSNGVIQTGYGTILGLVNLGFVVAIVVMAFATMFRRSGWDMQSSLARLIIAALLINFSLFFAGLVLDLGTKLIDAFLASSPCPGTGLANKFNIVNINKDVYDFLSNSVGGIGSVSAGDIMLGGLPVIVGILFKHVVVSILSIFFSSALTIIGALTLFGIFLFLIIRYVAVMILLIFMPIIWLGLVFPKLQLPGVGNAWSGWWQQYLRWVFYGPVIAFFLWLTIQFIDSLGSLAGAGLLQGIGQMLTVVIFSLGGLYAANKLSIAGASAVYGSVSKFGLKQLAGIKTSGMGIATSALKTQPAQKAMGWLAGGKLTIPGTRFKIPTGTKEIGRAGLEASVSTAPAGAEFLKRYKALPKDRLNDVLKGLRPNSAEHAALMEHMIKQGLLDKPEQYLTGRVKDGLRFAMKEGVYGDLEKFAVATRESIKALGTGAIDDAARELRKGVFSKAKPDDFKKKIGLSSIFKEINADDFKKPDKSPDMEAYNKAVAESEKKQEATVKGLLMTSPETIMAAYTSLVQGAQRVNFKEMASNIIHNKNGLSAVNIDSETPQRVKQWVPAMERFFERNVSKGIPQMAAEEIKEEVEAEEKG